MKLLLGKKFCSGFFFIVSVLLCVPNTSAADQNDQIYICKSDPNDPQRYETLTVPKHHARQQLEEGAFFGRCEDAGALVKLCWIGNRNVAGPVTVEVPYELARYFLRHGSHLGQCALVNGERKIKICHVPPGNPENAHTIEIAAVAVASHFPNHSEDFVGECPSTSCTQVTICDVITDGNGAGLERMVCQDQVRWYLENGAYLGRCQNGNNLVTICHKPFEPNPVTIRVNSHALRKHLNHGDILGSCDESPSRLCGNGKVEGTENCDDGSESNRCNEDCTFSVCGDGKVNIAAGEICDDGNRNNNDACLNSCVTARCGDGLVWMGIEACDDAGWSQTCNNDCSVSVCGDGKVNIQAGEQCDDGNTANSDGCSSTCQRESVCGNGILEPGEQCDLGANNSNAGACLVTCQTNSCGDGFVNQGIEQCDDGNLSDNDACKNNCTFNVCGDGYRRNGVEECDDGNTNNNDNCLNNCHIATCGDGFLRTGVEECDDGNDDETDACLTSCRFNTCHDGFVGPGESCDDGNYLDTDSCVGNCTLAFCGDGLLWSGAEACDAGSLNGAGPGYCLGDCSGLELFLPTPTPIVPLQAVESGGTDDGMDGGIIAAIVLGSTSFVGLFVVAGLSFYKAHVASLAAAAGQGQGL